MQFNPRQNSEFSRYMQFEQNKNKPVQKLDKLATTVKSRCVNIDSRDRNRDQFPNSNLFQVAFIDVETLSNFGITIYFYPSIKL